jgi:hypothetical protein
MILEERSRSALTTRFAYERDEHPLSVQRGEWLHVVFEKD